MATTTNYGWTTPDDTALVKDGASAIRTLGSSIDTTLKTQIDAQIPDTLLTTTGDVIYASAANTPARLGIGTTGQVLSVAAGLPAWATPSGGFTLVASGSLSGNSVSITGLASSEYMLMLNAWSENNAQTPSIRFNADTGNNYRIYGNSSNTSNIGDINTGTAAASNYYSQVYITLANTNAPAKPAFFNGASTPARGGVWISTSAITSIQITNPGANVFDAGTYQVWGR